MSLIQALGSVSKVRGALIFVEDVDRELAFYRDVVGLRLLYRTPTFVRPDVDPDRNPG
jgi:catechol 2,3-dioxygenase-like lactoylglutathione lyase family enzyme